MKNLLKHMTIVVMTATSCKTLLVFQPVHLAVSKEYVLLRILALVKQVMSKEVTVPTGKMSRTSS